MGRTAKWSFDYGLPPLREYWREINRHEREVKAQERAAHKVRDQRRPRCRCEAYPWPHRPGGGLCRYPDPPIERYRRRPRSRAYRTRYVGLRRQLARANGLHPIRDRVKIDDLMARAIELAKELKRRDPRVKYRNMEITANGIRGIFQTAGPMM